MTARSTGLSTERLARLDQVMTSRYVDTGRLPGILTQIYRAGEIVHTGMAGHIDLERGKPMREDAIFRIYSMSKPITAVALMMLAEEGLIGLDDDVATHIPSWKNLGVFATGVPSLIPSAAIYMTTPPVRPMKVVDLVTHTSGLTYGFMNRTGVDAAYRAQKIADFGTEGGLDTMIEQLSTVPLDFSPGTQWSYSVSIDVMGYLVQKLSGMSFGEFLRTRQHFFHGFTQLHLDIAKIRKPTIAMINGPAVGSGMDMALHCDIRIGCETTRFIGYHNAGQIIENGGSYYLPKMVGLGRALEFAYTGELSAERAYEWGMLNHLVPSEKLEATTRELCAKIIARPPLVQWISKRIMRTSIDTTMEATMVLTSNASPILQQSEDAKEARKAFVEKRKPQFKGV